MNVKLIDPLKHVAALQSSSAIGPKWSEDWELLLNPSNFPDEDASNHVTYALTFRTSPNPQPIQTVSTVQDLGLFQNTGLRAYGKVKCVLPKAILVDPNP